VNGWRAGAVFLLCWLLAGLPGHAGARDGSTGRPPAELTPLADPAGISTGNRAIDALLGQSPEAAAAASRAAARPLPRPPSLRTADAASAPGPENSLRDALLREAALNVPSRTPEREAADQSIPKPGEAGGTPARSERSAAPEALPEGLLAYLAALVAVLRDHRDTLLIAAAVVAVLAVVVSMSSRGSARQPGRPSARGRTGAASDRRSGQDRRIGHRGSSTSHASGSERRRA